MTSIEILKNYYGYDDFRDGQEILIDDILLGKDVLGIMPTGAGKSICFQVPALMADGITIVVSPLISLMKDQVNSLTQVGIAAAYINSLLNERQIVKALYNAANNMYKLIYVAPERLLTYEFLQFVTSANISMLTVDEAHCISQWGQDFRPSYTAIPEFISRLRRRPVVSAFTATATSVVQQDIVERLALNSPTVLVSGFDRKNLRFDVKNPGGKKFEFLLSFLEDKKNRSGIVYCATRANVESVCEKLQHFGYSASRYHAGLPDEERRNNQDDFLHDRVQIMVATNAFGMGIDKSNVSFVVHYNMPKDIEGYYQEAGRAGRDGEPAECILLYGGNDYRTNLWLIEENARAAEHLDKDTEAILLERNIKRLNEMDIYCKTNDCLRGYILQYFGENPPENCGNCSNCNADFNITDITIDAQKIVSCVLQMRERFGVKMVVDVLLGKKTAKLISFGLDRLTTYGISEKTAAELEEIINHMILHDYLHKTADRFPVIKLGARACEVSQENALITMKSMVKAKRISLAKADHRTLASVNHSLLTALKELRAGLAKEQKVPAYVVFHDSSLTDMCMKLPSTIDEFMEISGVGAMKASRYGEQFIKVIAQFCDDMGENTVLPAAKQEFDYSKIETTEDSVSVSMIADRINCVLLECGQAKISGKKINDWLVSQGYMTLVTEGTKSHKVPSEKGIQLGITTELRSVRGENVQINLFSNGAQIYIALNALSI